MHETPVTIVGNLTADPELRFTQNGVAVANFTIASTPRTFDRQTNDWKDGEPLFLRSSVWREFAENVAQTLTKGQRVIAQGFLKQRSFESQQGEKRTVIELDVQAIGPDLRYSTAQVTRTVGKAAGSAQGGFAAPQAPTGWATPGQAVTEAPSAMPTVWGAPGTAYTDETPF